MSLDKKISYEKESLGFKKTLKSYLIGKLDLPLRVYFGKKLKLSPIEAALTSQKLPDIAVIGYSTIFTNYMYIYASKLEPAHYASLTTEDKIMGGIACWGASIGIAALIHMIPGYIENFLRKKNLEFGRKDSLPDYKKYELRSSPLGALVSRIIRHSIPKNKIPKEEDLKPYKEIVERTNTF